MVARGVHGDVGFHPSSDTQRVAHHAEAPGGATRGGASCRAPIGPTGTHDPTPASKVKPCPPQDPDTWSRHYARYVALHHELGVFHTHIVEPRMRRDVLKLLEATTGRLLLLHAWLTSQLTSQSMSPETTQRIAAATYRVALPPALQQAAKKRCADRSNTIAALLQASADEQAAHDDQIPQSDTLEASAATAAAAPQQQQPHNTNASAPSLQAVMQPNTSVVSREAAAVVVQACFRGWSTRRRCRAQHTAEQAWLGMRPRPVC